MQSKFVIAIIAVIFVYFVTRFDVFSSSRLCNKWVFHDVAGGRIQNIEEAINVFVPFVKSEPYYSTLKIPSSGAGFVSQYNLSPYIETAVVFDSLGNQTSKSVYNMLLGFVIDENGMVYKYKRCQYLW